MSYEPVLDTSHKTRVISQLPLSPADITSERLTPRDCGPEWSSIGIFCDVGHNIIYAPNSHDTGPDLRYDGDFPLNLAVAVCHDVDTNVSKVPPSLYGGLHS